jgi:hypothetical protein
MSSWVVFFISATTTISFVSGEQEEVCLGFCNKERRHYRTLYLLMSRKLLSEIDMSWGNAVGRWY